MTGGPANHDLDFLITHEDYKEDELNEVTVCMPCMHIVPRRHMQYTKDTDCTGKRSTILDRKHSRTT